MKRLQRMLTLLFGLLALTTVLAIGAGQLGWLAGQPPTDLGVHEGRLQAPSNNPNSVSSQADLWPGHPQQAYARIAPLALVESGADAGAATLARLRQIIENTPGAQVVHAGPDYLRATFSTPLMKYTDDAEFWSDRANGVVQLRSASRLGRSDLGTNRKRVEGLRTQLAAR